MSGYINAIPILLLVLGIFEDTTPLNTEGQVTSPGSNQNVLHRRLVSADPPGADSMFGPNGNGRRYHTNRQRCVRHETHEMRTKGRFAASKARNSPSFEVYTTSKRITGYQYQVPSHRSPSFNEFAGVYIARVSGLHKFRVRDLGVEGPGSVTWYVCGDNGKREKVEGFRIRQSERTYNDTVLQCKAGDRIWLEGVASQPGVMMNSVSLSLWSIT